MELKMRNPRNEVVSHFVLVAKWRVTVLGVPSVVWKLGMRIETAFALREQHKLQNSVFYLLGS